MKTPNGYVIQTCGFMETMKIGDGFNLRLLRKCEKDLEDAKAFIVAIIIVLKRRFENLAPLQVSSEFLQHFTK